MHLSLFHSLNHSLPYSLSHTLSLFLYLSLSLVRSLSVSLYLALSVSLYLPYGSRPISQPASPVLCIDDHSIFMDVFLATAISIHISIYHCVCVCRARARRFGMRGIIAEAHVDGSRNTIVELGGLRRIILTHPR